MGADIYNRSVLDKLKPDNPAGTVYISKILHNERNLLTD